MLIVGIDPGLSGAIALVRGDDLLLVDDLPAEAKGGAGKVRNRLAAGTLAGMLRGYRSRYDEAFLAVVELVNAMPGQGSASVYSLGDTAGAIRGVLQSVGFSLEFVPAAVWKRAMKIGADKDVARTLASQRWPESAHLWAKKARADRAEAALIAAWGWDRFA